MQRKLGCSGYSPQLGGVIGQILVPRCLAEAATVSLQVWRTSVQARSKKANRATRLTATALVGGRIGHEAQAVAKQSVTASEC